MIRPSTNPVTLNFGVTTPPYSPQEPHKGTDFSYLPDDRTYAPEGGRAELTYNDPRMGNAVHIYVDDRHHALCHMKSFAVGQGPVRQGQILGIMGDTGFTQGKHLHWALSVGGILVNPLDYVKEDNVTDQQINTTVNGIRILAGVPKTKLAGMLKEWKPKLQADYPGATVALLKKYVDDPTVPVNATWRKDRDV